MMMRSGQRYRCQNAECAAEIEVTKGSIEGQSNPRCSCGAEMKKPYTKPLITMRDMGAPVVTDISENRG
jgi:hypothetical protein